VWRKLPEPTDDEVSEFNRVFGRRARFLLDEDMPEALPEALRESGWNSIEPY